MRGYRTHSYKVLVTATALIASLIGASGGCASNNSGTDRSKQAVASMDQFKQDALAMRTQMDSALAALNSLQTTNDLSASFANYSKQVDAVGADAAKMKAAVADMQARVQEYVQKWQEEMATVSDPSLKAIAEQRRQAVQTRFTEIQARHKAASDAYNTFYGDLSSLRSYLANDLTPAGVTAAAPAIKKANDDRKSLKLYGDELLRVLDEVSAGMATPPPPQPAQTK